MEICTENSQNTIPKIEMWHSVWVYAVSSGFYIRGQKYRERSPQLKSTWKGNDAHVNSLWNSTLTWDTLYDGSCWHLPVMIHCQERVLACREHWDVAGHWWCNNEQPNHAPLTHTCASGDRLSLQTNGAWICAINFT